VEVLLKNSGYKVLLKLPVGAGGVGEARLHGTNQTVLGKVFFEELPFQKLEYLIAHPVVPSRSGYRFAWPIDIGLHPVSNEPVCFFMTRAEDAVDFEAICKAGHWLPLKFLYRVAHHHACSLFDLEQANIHRGDMPNSMVHQDGSITEIDLDSVQITRPDANFTCGWVKHSTIPPELIRFFANDRKDFITTSEHDRWSFAVMLWMLLNGGEHPFACRWLGAGGRPPLLERIERGLWPHSSLHPEVAPRRGSKSLSDFDPELAYLFRRTFDSGHASPQQRPLVGEWIAVLSRLDSAGDVTLSLKDWECVKQGTVGQPAAPPAKPLSRETGLVVAASVCLLAATAAGIRGLASGAPPVQQNNVASSRQEEAVSYRGRALPLPQRADRKWRSREAHQPTRKIASQDRKIFLRTDEGLLSERPTRLQQAGYFPAKDFSEREALSLYDDRRPEGRREIPQLWTQLRARMTP